MMDKKSVIVGMSGGLDSAITAYRLLKDGFNVSGVFFRPWRWGDENKFIEDEELWINNLSKSLGIHIEILDQRKKFKEKIINKYIELIEEGLTPNPCIFCNPSYKYNSLMQVADKKKVYFVATGHYAINMNMNGEWKLFKGRDNLKDQSYMLCQLNQKILSRTLLPLGLTYKHDNKKLAKEIGLDYSNTPESQDLCFLEHHDQKKFLNRFLKNGLNPGPIHDLSGSLLGHHDGLALYTIGQRKGIRIPAEKSYYVMKKDLNKNILIIGHKEELGSNRIMVSHMNWISGKSIDYLKCEVKIRYHSKSHNAVAKQIDKDIYQVKFNQKIPDLTPGQFAVFYDQDEMLGGGMISEVLN